MNHVVEHEKRQVTEDESVNNLKRIQLLGVQEERWLLSMEESGS